MDLTQNAAFDTFAAIWAQAEIYLRTMLLPSRLWQFAILLGCALLAHLARALLAPRLDAFVRGRDLSKPQIRRVVLLRQRLRGLVFVLCAWAAALILAQAKGFYSWRFLVVLAATLVTAWLAIGLVTRLIGNRVLRRIVAWAAWICATLYYLGVLDDMAALLDRAAVSFGGFRLSALAVVKALAVTALLVSLARIVSGRASARISADEDISPSMRVLVVKLLQVALYGAAVFIGLKAVGFDLTGLAVLSGAIGVGLGFGLQKVVSNLVSGIIILLDKSVKPGDVISLGDTFGWIDTLGARYASVVTRDGKAYLIPNEDLITGQVVNWSHRDAFVRIDLDFGASYHDDPHLVRRVATEATRGVGRVLAGRPVVCHITGFGESAIDYRLRFWITDPVEGLANVRGAVFLALWDAFRANGISLPFPQRELRLLPGAELHLRRGPAPDPAPDTAPDAAPDLAPDRAPGPPPSPAGAPGAAGGEDRAPGH